MKKAFKVLLSLLIMLIFTFSVNKVNAAQIEIERDDNPSGVTVFNARDNYYVIITDDNGIGYVYYFNNSHEEIIGTCTVLILDNQNGNNYLLCTSSENALGSIEVTINDSNQVITSATGEISNIFNCGTTVVISE